MMNIKGQQKYRLTILEECNKLPVYCLGQNVSYAFAFRDPDKKPMLIEIFSDEIISVEGDIVTARTKFRKSNGDADLDAILQREGM